MEHKEQTHNNCLAYALWQVGIIDELAVREYETGKFEGQWDKMTPWVEKYVPGLLKLKGTVTVSSFGALTGTWDLTGKGIIIVRTRLFAHCISYEKGLVLSPDGLGEYMTLEEFLEKHPGWEVAEVIPAEDMEEKKCTQPIAD